MKGMLKFVGLGIGIVIVFGLIILSNNNDETMNGIEYNEFAQCLNDKGAKMWGAFWCGACDTQKKLFGSSFSKINYIECGLVEPGSFKRTCSDAGITSTPTWEFNNGERISKVLTLKELSEKTGCNLPI